jgi:hypothetical protein
MELEFDHLLDETILPEETSEISSNTEVILPDVLIGEEEIVEEPKDTNTKTEDDENDEDVLTLLLKNNGISDPTKIQFENENGEIEDVDFKSLSKEEQLTMIYELTRPELSQHEVEVVNYLRQNRVSFNEVIDYFANQRLEEYLNEHPEDVRKQNYSIDDYNDDELYLADLKSKYPSFSDEELLSKLHIAKSDEDLFQKEVDILRENYKAQEDQMRKDAELAEQQQYADLQNNLIEAVSKFNEISLDTKDATSDSLVIEDADKHQILAYLLNQDDDGKSQFVKDIENPATLIELAWYRNYGRGIIDGISQYWKDELKTARKKIASLEKQLGDSKSNKTVIASNKPKTNSPSKGLNWDGLI